MKTLLSFTLVAFLFISATGTAQQTYTVDGKQYTLSTEADGALTLLWAVVDGEYRYFAKKSGAIIELKNTKMNGKYQEEYKGSLKTLTNDAPVSAQNTKLTLPSLKDYFNTYNKKKDPNYTVETKNIQLKTRLGAFVGVTNSIFTDNPTNAFQPVAGVDFEIFDEVKLKRHAVVIRFKQTFESSEYAFSASQLSLNYRFKFVISPRFDAYINAKFVTYTYVEREVFQGTPPVAVPQSGGDLTAPAIFGLGADYRLGNGYLTFNYNDIVGIGVDSNGEFPLEFTLGYKFNL